MAPSSDGQQSSLVTTNTAAVEPSNETKLVRIVHWTDVHFHVLKLPTLLPTWKQCLGLAHLYIKRRKDDFLAAELVPTMVQQIDSLHPDLCIFSGDLTALGLPAEFELAKSMLSPLLEKYPNIMIAGNHDRYTRQSAYLMEEYFGDYMRGGKQWDAGKWKEEEEEMKEEEDAFPRVYDDTRWFGLKIVVLDQARPSKWSFGENSAPQLHRLERLLEELDASRCIVVGHYPVCNADGSLSDTFGRSLKDVGELYQVLCRQPPLAYLCGHDHQHYVQYMQVGGGNGQVPLICCGSTSYLGKKAQKKAGFYEITVEIADNNDSHHHLPKPRIFSIVRYEWNNCHQQFEKLEE